jgi:hypothetical protein
MDSGYEWLPAVLGVMLGTAFIGVVMALKRYVELSERRQARRARPKRDRPA